MFLYFMDPPLHGPAIRRLQEMLLELGYDVGTYGADGWFGHDTLKAVLRWQLENTNHPSGVIDADSWRLLEEQVTTVDPARNVFDILDYRGQHDHPKLYRESRSPRPWSKITGVTLHQTACIMADRRSRWSTLNAHIGVFRDGTIILVNDPTDFIWHAQGFSHETIGIEFNGNFPGISGNRHTWWAPGGDMCSLTAGQKAAVPRLFDWLKGEFEAHDAEWKHVYAHRQATKDRRADPGSEIWKEVGMPWIAELGATDGGPAFTYGTGLPIPHAWNPAYPTTY